MSARTSGRRSTARSHLYIGGSIIALIFAAALLAPWISSYDPRAISLPDSLAPPSWKHWLGCDNHGADILSILVFGARLSLLVAGLATAASVSIGLVIGSLAGYSGGWIDQSIMRFLDMIFAFPGVILAIAITTITGPSQWNLILALTVTGWAGYARLVRGEVRVLKEREFVQAAQALGLSPLRIVVVHIWPNLVSPLAVAATFGLAGTILAEASLSFLGIGVPPGTPSWGSLLNQGRDFLIEAPHISTFPGIAIMVTILGFNFLGEGLREYLDPKG